MECKNFIGAHLYHKLLSFVRNLEKGDLNFVLEITAGHIEGSLGS